jgi:GTP pyrophosphokinase
MGVPPSTYASLADAYREEQPVYERLAQYMEEQLRTRLKEEAVHATVTSRAKDVESFVAKALIGGRYENAMEQIADKAGVRAVVIYEEDVDRVEGICRELFHVRGREQKLDALAYNESGYLAVHLDTVLRDGEAEGDRAEFGDRRVEIQIRTMAQSAWAEVSHEQLYKPAVEVPDSLKRRIYRLVSLVELFDSEVSGFLQEARETEGYAEAQALVPLQKLLLTFDSRLRPDRQLSLLMAAAIVPLYGRQPPDVFPEVIEPWLHDEKRNEVANVLGQAAELDNPNPLLRQPEIFLILERLENDRRHLQDAWPEEVPYSWLEEVAESWAVGL